MGASLSTRRRRARRGAAMVEAAVVIPVMLIFLGLIVFTSRSYAKKLDKQTGTRASALYYASHNCEGDTPDSISRTTDSADPGGDSTTADTTAQKLRPTEQAGLQRSWNMAKAKPQDTTINGSAVNDRQTIFFSRTIHAESEVVCNEKRHDEPWTGVIDMIAGIARGGGGGFID